MVFVTVFALMAVPVWLYTFHSDSDESAWLPKIKSDPWNALTHMHAPPHSMTVDIPAATQKVDAGPPHGDIAIPFDHWHDSHADDRPEPADGDTANDEITHPAEEPQHTTDELEMVYDPMTFALIMWGEDSAAEGAILLKVRRCSID